VPHPNHVFCGLGGNEHRVPHPNHVFCGLGGKEYSSHSHTRTTEEVHAKEKLMALIDSTTGNIIRNYSIEELRDAANLMGGYDLVALCAAG